MNEIFEGEVLTLSSEGFGILRQNDLVIFVPFTAPGDKIRYRIEKQKKNFAIGILIEVLEASPNRIQPLCRYFGRCGGCQLQQMKYDAQIESKQQIVHEALKRIGKFKNIPLQNIQPAELYWAYRRHITLKIHAKDQILQAGYVSIDHVSILDVKQCPIFIEEDNTVILELQFLLKNISSHGFSSGSATLFKTQNKKFILNLRFENPLVFENSYFEEFLNQHKRWLGVILYEGNRRKTWGVTQEGLEIDGMSFSCSPDVFTQIHPEQSLKIYQQIAQITGKKSSLKIWDLYCGIGISSLLMARQGHAVLGIEFNHAAIAFAKENAILNKVTSVSFLQGDVQQVLRKKLRIEKPDVILVNPPRVGIDPHVAEEILKRKPKEIIYISCMPSTLARDLNILCKKDYMLTFVKPYDMFPQTYHVETLVHLELNY